MSVYLREVEHSDWEDIKELYTIIYNRSIPKGLETAFFQHSNLLGYCLITNSQEANQKVVGYFGCFTYNRTIEGTAYKFYNMHTWIVKEEYRKHAIKLLMPFIKIKDGIVTNFTPTLEVYKMLKGVKFNEQRINRYSYQTSFFKSFSIAKTLEYTNNPNSLNREDSSVVSHHLIYKNTNFHQLTIKNTGTTFWILTRNTTLKHELINKINNITRVLIKKPLVTRSYRYEIVHYCNNWSLLKEYFRDTLAILQKRKVGGLICSEDLLSLPELNRKEQENEFHTYKTSDKLNFRLDLLYSEIFYLDVFNR